ncbi:MAG: sigma factor-like helix-turn-helix DNA-binding protein [Caldilineaceae bacterium]
MVTIEQAIAQLPANLQTVLMLRDVEGWTAADTCLTLGLSAGNQRVLLHRARVQVRQALESYFAD